MFLTENKLEQRIASLKNYIYRDYFEASAIYVLEEEGDSVNPAVPAFTDEWKKIGIGDYWRGKDCYLWIHLEATLPEKWKNRRMVGLFDFGTTGVGNNSGFEAMLYLHQKPYQGVDINHQEVLLPNSFAGTTEYFDFRLWSGRNPSEIGGIPEHKIKSAGFAWIDDDAEDLYYTGKTVLETLKLLDENDALKFRLRNLLNDSFLLIDWSFPGETHFYSSVKEALDFLKKGLEEIPKDTAVTVNCVGHTHIDVAWLWRTKNTREKASRSFSTVLRLMERYPEYVFLQTQPQLYEYIKKDFPDIFAQIKERVAEGRWEIEGSMWVEADCNLISGESFTRQILMAKKFAREEFGKDMEYLWLPDVFGYSWAMPQILKKSGINTFMTTKISWNQYNRMPYDTFWWKGMDGTEILTHFITTPDPDNDLGPWYYTYNGMVTPYTIKGIWDNYKQKDINQELLLDYGYGDGGGGVNREMLEMKRRASEMPGLPQVVSSTAGKYFRKLHETMENTAYRVPKWDGELYLELCQGTYTSHAFNKKANRRMEFLYRLTEWYMAMVKANAGRSVYEEHERLNEGWKLILLNQFHDIIPGSSIHEVYVDSAKDYAQIQSMAAEIQKDLLPDIIQEDPGWYTVVNAANWDTDSLVEIPSDIHGAYADENGQLLPVQYTDHAALVSVTNIPAMGMKSVKFLPEAVAEEQKSPFRFSDHSVDTPFYHIEWNAFGQLTSLIDLSEDRQIIAPGMRANVFQVFEDKPLAFDAWDIDIFYQEKHWEVDCLKSVSIVETGPLRAVIRMQWAYRKSTICQDLMVYSENRRIDFRTTVDFHGHHQLLKVAFPMDVFANYATYDIQYGNMRRANHWNTSWDMARYEVFAHRFADLSERNYGVSLLNDCKYGYDIKENVIRLSLIKTATDPDPEQDQGLHEFTYSLLPHAGDFLQGQTVKEAFFLNQPLLVLPGKALHSEQSFIRFSSESVELDAIKEAEDGKSIVVRFHDYTGGSSKVQVIPGFSFEKWAEADLMENPTEDFRREKEVIVSVKPYEIITLVFAQ